MKCKDCPMYSHKPETEWRDGESEYECLLKERDCNLTETDITIINSMIDGTWRCDNCKNYISDISCGIPEWNSPKTCMRWQQKEE